MTRTTYCILLLASFSVFFSTITHLIIFSPFLGAHSASVAKGKNVIKCPKPNKCTCPGDPVTERYSDPADPSCDRYYLCHMGNAFLKYCDVRQAFHPEKRECLPRTSVAFELCPTAVECVKNGFQPDIKDCTMYYMCFYRQAYHYGCKADHYYDREQEECVKDAVKALSCNKARSELQPETSYPAKHTNKRMPEDFVPLPDEVEHEDEHQNNNNDTKQAFQEGRMTLEEKKIENIDTENIEEKRESQDDDEDEGESSNDATTPQNQEFVSSLGSNLSNFEP